MKKRELLLLGSMGLGLVLCGCAAHNAEVSTPDPDEEAHVDAAVINAVGDKQMANAIVTQHTLYPYHFVTGTADLNELGQRDLDVLAKYYRSHPGELNIHGAGEPAELTHDRMHNVQETLVHGGIDMSRMKIVDGVAGGDGMDSEHVLRILARDEKDAGQGYTDSTGGTANGGGSSSGAMSNGQQEGTK